ncbi:hypothetical protein, partial [Bilophila wadsworthia]|uniref:hypothetical protein n=1 Tax=Bilophila wadsworthia TaxID=35833 RepID=UPI003AB1846C
GMDRAGGVSAFLNPSLQLSLRRNGLPLLADRQCFESGALKKSASGNAGEGKEREPCWWH